MDALYDDLLYYNACLAIHKGGYKQAKYCFDKISNTNKMIFQQYSTGCRYHLFKGNINAAYQEAFKYKLFYEDSNTYVLAISYIEQFLGNFQNSIDILKNIDKPDERMLLLLAKAYMKIVNIKNARVCVEQRNLTIITISHRIDFLKDVDRIVVLDNGCIKEETTYNKYAMK